MLFLQVMYNEIYERVTHRSIRTIFGLFFGLCTVLTVWMQIETVHQLEGWRWRFQQANGWDWGIAGLWMVAAFALVWGCFKAQASQTKLLSLFLLGLVIQWGPALSTGEGIVGLEDRAVSTGHREFSVIASHSLGFCRP